MFFQNQVKRPQSLIPYGMLFLVIALIWPRYIHLSGSLSPGWTDGLRGLLFGVSIGINLMAGMLAARQRRSA